LDNEEKEWVEIDTMFDDPNENKIDLTIFHNSDHTLKVFTLLFNVW